MKLKDKIKQSLKEGNYIVKGDDLDKLGPEIEQDDPEAIIKVIDEEETDDSYNTYAVCTNSISKTAGTTERSKWSDDDKKRYEDCIKGLKGKEGYKLSESNNPKITKKMLIETVTKFNQKTNIIKTIKVKNLLK